MTDMRLEVQENRDSFRARLEGRFSLEDTQLIMAAYDLAKEAHRPQLRLTGERAFEHARSVALILLDECGVNDPDLVIAGLLHDTGEDSAIFGSAFVKVGNEKITLSFDDWSPTARFRLERFFNARVASIVIALTKARVDGRQCPDKPAANRFNYGRLEDAVNNGNWEVILLKEADRLHNLRCVGGTKIVEKTLKETHEVHIPIFSRAVEVYAAWEGEVVWLRLLLGKIIDEVRKLESFAG